MRIVPWTLVYLALYVSPILVNIFPYLLFHLSICVYLFRSQTDIELKRAPIHWFTSQIPSMTKDQRWMPGIQSRSPIWVVRTPAPQPSLLLSTAALPGSWSQEPELGVGPIYSNMELGVVTAGLMIFNIKSSFQNSLWALVNIIPTCFSL